MEAATSRSQSERSEGSAMTPQQIRKYNPGFLTDAELLETFCVRQVEFESLLDTLRGCTGPANQPQIVIGPRGSGKTTLLLRLAAEVRRDPALSAPFFPVLFAEESYEVSTAGEFWLECLSQLAGQAPVRPEDPDLQRTAEALRGDMDDRSLADRCLGALLDFADRENKRLVLFVENLNMMFRDMVDSDAGWRLRKVLQTEPRIVLIASATNRFDEMDHPDHALYDMFRVCVLRRLDTAECAALWERVSGRNVEQRTIRSLEILTGGSPRLVAIVARFGAARSFRNLMDELLDLVDDHTEYFKSHLEALPPQERRVYLALADLWRPATTREIAERCRLSTSKCSAQLTRLMERGVVQVEGGTARRKEYYLAERLYNIYYLLRRRRGPTPLVEALIRFMESFYSPPELAAFGAQIARDAAQLTPEMRALYRHAFTKLAAVPTLTEYLRDLRAVAPDDFAKGIARYLSPPRERVAPEEDAGRPSTQASVPNVGAEKDAKLEKLASELLDASSSGSNAAFKKATASYDAALIRLALNGAPSRLEPLAVALVNRSAELARRNEAETALHICEDVERRFGAIQDTRLLDSVAKALVNKGAILAEMSRAREALAVWDDVVLRFSRRLEAPLCESVAISLVNKGMVLARLNRPTDVLDVCDDVVRRFGNSEASELAEQVAKALVNRGAALSGLDRLDDAIAAWDDVVQRFGKREEQAVRECVVKALENKAMALASLNRREDEVAVWDELVRHGDGREEPIIEPVARALGSKGVALLALDQAEDALSCWDNLVQRFDRKELPDLLDAVATALSNKGAAFLALGQPADALEVWDSVVERFGSSDDLDVLKIVAASLSSKAQVFDQMGRREDALNACDQLLQRFGQYEASEIVNEVVKALVNKAAACLALNRPKAALSACDTALDRLEASDQPERHEILATVLVNRGSALATLSRPLEAIPSWDEVVRRYGQNDEPELVECVATALAYKGLAFRQVGRLDDAVIAWDELVRRYIESETQSLLSHAARALVNKGIALLESGEPEIALETWNHVVRRFRDNDVLDLRKQFVVALMNRGTAFFQTDRLNDAVTTWDEVVCFVREDDDPALLKMQASALANKAVAFVGQANRVDDAMASWDEIVRLFGESEGPFLPEFVAQALADKAALLIDLNRPDDALRLCNEVVRRFGKREVAALRNQVARALVHRGYALTQLHRTEDSLAAFDEVVRRFDGDETPALRKWSETALLAKASGELSRGDYDAAIEAAGRLVAEARRASPEHRWQGYGLRAQAVFAKGNRDACEEDVRAIMEVLPTLDRCPAEAVHALMVLSILIGAESMSALIQASGSKELLLPLTTALEQELGGRPRVPLEVEEVAKDIRAALAKIRQAPSAPAQ